MKFFVWVFKVLVTHKLWVQNRTTTGLVVFKCSIFQFCIVSQTVNKKVNGCQWQNTSGKSIRCRVHALFQIHLSKWELDRMISASASSSSGRIIIIPKMNRFDCEMTSVWGSAHVRNRIPLFYSHTISPSPLIGSLCMKTHLEHKRESLIRIDCSSPYMLLLCWALCAFMTHTHTHTDA